MRVQSRQSARAAARFAEQVSKLWYGDQWFVREHVWAIHAAYIRSSGQEGEDEGEPGSIDQVGYNTMVKAAERILELTQETLPVRRTVFAVAKEA
ncbi:MAG: hypothetical protein NUW23_13540 [Firmicutes bacterium]|jgi:hypothetical protein|nr:hypothetical protein [Bacillota bacterium]